MQIFATTHSPFVVAGLKSGQVHLLKRDENGVVTAETNTEDVIGWTADEILRTMMGVDEPTDQLTVDRANKLRQLREKETLTPEEESELNELRRQVNESLLSRGGPLEVEREPLRRLDAALSALPSGRLDSRRRVDGLRWVDRGPKPDGVAEYARQFTQGWVNYYQSGVDEQPTDFRWVGVSPNAGGVGPTIVAGTVSGKPKR